MNDEFVTRKDLKKLEERITKLEAENARLREAAEQCYENAATCADILQEPLLGGEVDRVRDFVRLMRDALYASKEPTDDSRND